MRKQRKRLHKNACIVIIVVFGCINLCGCASHKVRSANLMFPFVEEGPLIGVKYDTRNIRDGFADGNPVQIVLSVIDLPFSLLWDLMHFPVDSKEIGGVQAVEAVK